MSFLMGYPTNWRENRPPRPSRAGPRGAAEATLGAASSVIAGELAWTGVGGAAAELAIEGALVGALGPRAVPVVLGGIVLGAAVGYGLLAALTALEEWLPGGNWRHCCTDPLTLTHGVVPGYLASGYDYAVAGTVPCTGLPCSGAQADSSPFAPAATNSQTRRFYWKYQIAPGVYRYDVVSNWTRNAALALPARAPTRPQVPVATDFIPRFALPRETAGDFRTVTAFPVAIPWPLIPAARPLPLSHQTRTAGYTVDEGYPARHGPVIAGDLYPGDNHVTPVPGVAPIPRAYSTPRDKKVQPPKQIMAAFQAMAAVSELNDFIGCLFLALPADIRKMYPNTARGRLEALAAYPERIDWFAAVTLLALNETQDQAYGRTIGRVRGAAHASGNGDLWRISQSGQ